VGNLRGVGKHRRGQGFKPWKKNLIRYEKRGNQKTVSFTMRRGDFVGKYRKNITESVWKGEMDTVLGERRSEIVQGNIACGTTKKKPLLTSNLTASILSNRETNCICRRGEEKPTVSNGKGFSCQQ